MKRILSICILAALAATARAETYPAAFIVKDIDRSADVITLEDSVGLTWKAYGVEDWQPGDMAAAIMDDVGTVSIYDDRIIDLRYAGTVSSFAH